MERLNWHITLAELFSQFIFNNLSVTDSMSLVGDIQNGIKQEALNNDALLIETLKFIGLMEASIDIEELKKLNDKRKEIKQGKQELTDFDKILKGIIAVPNKKEEKK